MLNHCFKVESRILCLRTRVRFSYALPESVTSCLIRILSLIVSAKAFENQLVVACQENRF